MLDLLFIDGDHSYEGVRQDYKMYSKLVRDGGLIAFTMWFGTRKVTAARWIGSGTN